MVKASSDAMDPEASEADPTQLHHQSYEQAKPSVVKKTFYLFPNLGKPYSYEGKLIPLGNSCTL